MLEYQLSSVSLNAGFVNARNAYNYVNLYKQLSVFTVHLPYHLCEVAQLVLQKDIMYDLRDCICTLRKEIKEYTTLNIVIHNSLPVSLYGEKVISELRGFFISFENRGVNFFIENTPAYLKSGSLGKAFSFDLVRELGMSNVYCLYDVCHGRCIDNYHKVKFSIPEDMKDKVKWIHFAATLNSDGLLNPKTHGVAHRTTESFINDWKLVKEYAENGIPIVVEINEADKNNQYDMLREIKDIKSLLFID